MPSSYFQELRNEVNRLKEQLDTQGRRRRVQIFHDPFEPRLRAQDGDVMEGLGDNLSSA